METSTGKLHYSESKSGSRTRRRWRIQYRGRTYHFERLAGETRLESYRRCSLLWEAQKVEIDALENPQNIRDQVVDVLTSMLGIAAGSGDTGGLQPVEYDASASLVAVTMLASHTFTSAAIPAAGTPMDFIFTGSSAALTNLIDNWLTLNPGILLKHSDVTPLGDNKRVRFHSSEAADFDLRPQLIINYSEPIPPAPEPATSALLGLGGMLVLGLARRR